LNNKRPTHPQTIPNKTIPNKKKSKQTSELKNGKQTELKQTDAINRHYEGLHRIRDTLRKAGQNTQSHENCVTRVEMFLPSYIIKPKSNPTWEAPRPQIFFTHKWDYLVLR
jgi:hypothetical protein